ncbi:enterochelin esterase [Cryptosporangium aurantiacum]|uniref:Enterochelin esterase n=1 Tax=Cryptosporangium aurantiacum TaxID=134849 RepID=A0A1M7Q7P2_9ACTN|nr:enterochelin esterase [Cryptosporangium aurantiacum]SHN26486.1 enterochelin esterase [Cryptosporangium aurantiacum]
MHRPRPYALPLASSPRLAVVTPDTVTAFWASVETTPLVEPDGEEYLVTWLWRDAEAADVVLHLNKMTDYHDLRQSRFRRLEDTDLWHLTYRLPGTYRGSYRIGPLASRVAPPSVPPDKTAWRRLREDAVADPRNPVGLPDGTSVVELPDAPPQPWLAGVPVLTSHQVGGRRVWVRADAGVDLPVVVLLDGDVWAGDGVIGGTLDALVAAGRIPPHVALFVDSGSTRVHDLACSPEFLGFLTGELLPWAAERWPVTADPARTVLAGQSMGGLTAAYGGLYAADRFGAVLAQSGSWWFPGGRPEDVPENWLTGEYARRPRTATRYWLEVGRREWDLIEQARRFRDVLLAKGYDVTHREYDGGHDLACWRGGLADGLIVLLGDA